MLGVTDYTPVTLVVDAFRFLLQQGRPGSMVTNKDGIRRCVYRAPDGSRCGIGGLIPDDLYEPAMEEEGTLEALSKLGVTESAVIDTAYIIQDLHDNWASYGGTEQGHIDGIDLLAPGWREALGEEDLRRFFAMIDYTGPRSE